MKTPRQPTPSEARWDSMGYEASKRELARTGHALGWARYVWCELQRDVQNDLIKLWNKNLIVISAIAFTYLVGAAETRAQQTTIYGPNGNVAGTVTRDSAGTETFRDARGNTSGTATRDSAGTVTYRDARGATVGTSTRSGGARR